jgi:hypothetical protein
MTSENKQAEASSGERMTPIRTWDGRFGNSAMLEMLKKERKKGVGKKVQVLGQITNSRDQDCAFLFSATSLLNSPPRFTCDVLKRPVKI